MRVLRAWADSVPGLIKRHRITRNEGESFEPDAEGGCLPCGGRALDTFVLLPVRLHLQGTVDRAGCSWRMNTEKREGKETNEGKL